MTKGKGGRPAGLPKTGGRKKGTPNKATQDVAEKLAALGFDPIEGMAEIARDKKNSADVRLRSCIELAQYLYPKRKPVDISNEQPIITNVITKLDSSPEGQNAGNQPSFEP